MNINTAQIVNKAWNYAHVLRDDGLSYMAYTEQITFLLFLKMADELTKPPYNRPPIVPPKYGWGSLLKLDGAAFTRGCPGPRPTARRASDCGGKTRHSARLAPECHRS